MIEIVNNLPDTNDGFRIDTVTFSLAVDANGKVSLIEELSAGLASSINIILQRGNRNV